MKFLLELKDDLVLISTWQPSSESWYCWGSVHIDALYTVTPPEKWYQQLTSEGKVIVSAEFTLGASFG